MALRARPYADRPPGMRGRSIADMLGHVGFWGAAVVIAALGWMLLREAAQTAEVSDRVVRSESALQGLRDVEEQFRRVGWNHREFLLSRDPRGLTARDDALRALNEGYERLQALAVAEATLREGVARLGASLTRRIEIMQTSQVVLERGELEAARRAELSAVAADANTQVQSVLRQLTGAQQRMLLERRELERRHFRGIQEMLIRIVAIGVLLLAPAYLGFVLQSRARGRAEAKLLDMADRVPGVIYQLRILPDGRSRFEFIGGNLPALRGVERNDALRDADKIWNTVLPDDRPALDEAGREAVRRLQPIERDFRIRMPDGSVRWLHTSGSHRREPDGSVIRNGYWSDITAQKRIEEQLLEAKQRLSEITGGLPGIIYQWWLAPDGTTGLSFVSGATLTVLGLTPELMLSQPALAQEQILGEDRDALALAIRQSAATLGPLQTEFRVLREGNVRWHSVNAIPQRRPDGTVLWNGYWTDITERKALEHSLAETRDAADAANRAKSAFLATMSHEIRTPINAVLGLLELLGATPLDRDQRAMLDVVRESGHSLQRIIDDILDFSKIEAGKIEIKPAPVSPRHLVESVSETYSSAASARGLLLRHHVDPAVSPAVWADALRLRQILGNLVSNAIKFTERGSVDVEARSLDRADGCERLCFTVRDTGIGIAPEDQIRLFEPFAQAASHVTGRAGGTGLGLAISRRLASLMGGTLEMESEPGRGTTMRLTVSLPIADRAELPALERWATARPPVAPAGRAPTVEQAEAEGTLVLLVDDHPTNRLVLRTQLDALGYAALTARHGLEALKLLLAHRIALMVVDCNMPEMTGHQLARSVREREALDHSGRVPMIGWTANAMTGEAQACFAAGMDDFLLKPTTLAQVKEKLDRWLPLPVAPEAPAPAPAPALAPEPAARASHDAVLDRSTLAQFAGGNAAVERQILGDFLRISEADIGTVRQALDQRDSRQLLTASHRLVGASQMLGAVGVARAAEALDQVARAGDEPALEGAFVSLTEALARLRAHLDEAAGSPGAGARRRPAHATRGRDGDQGPARRRSR